MIEKDPKTRKELLSRAAEAEQMAEIDAAPGARRAWLELAAVWRDLAASMADAPVGLETTAASGLRRNH